MSAPRIEAPAVPEPTDAQLVARALDRDEAACTLLVHRHVNTLYRHARGMGLDHDTGLDLVQEAFVRAFDRLADCRDGAHFRAWVFRICRNLCLDELRNVRRLCVPMSSVEGADELESTHNAEHETTMTLSVALDRLPHALREAFLLKHDAGYTYEEVAEITEASPSAVKMRVHRAREALRAFLTAQGFGGTVDLEDEGDNPAVANRLVNEAERNSRNSPPSGAHPKVLRTADPRRMS
jgi:RNA polymerase sigma-70 factor (ECF subfamily)